MIGTFAALTILMVMFPMPAAYAYVWYSEDNGEANLTVEWGAPYRTIAEYSTHTLKLGERCIVYASATAEGSMYVYGRATETTWVTGSIYWYRKGCFAGGGIPPNCFNAWIKAKFQAVDITAGGALVEKVILDKDIAWSDEGTWCFDQMDISLTQNHYYKFALYVEVHADAIGEGSAIADFGGIWWEDSRIEWGYLAVPYVELAQPVCAMKPIFGLYDPENPITPNCYFPDVPATRMKVELLFDIHDLEGDQTVKSRLTQLFQSGLTETLI